MSESAASEHPKPQRPSRIRRAVATTGILGALTYGGIAFAAAPAQADPSDSGRSSMTEQSWTPLVSPGIGPHDAVSSGS